MRQTMMRQTIWMLGLSLAMPSLAAQAEETSGPMLLPNANAGAPAPSKSTPRATAPGLDPDGTLSLRAQDIATVDLIQQIANAGQLQVLVDADVQGRLRLINISKKTPEKALELVAQACRLEIQKKGAVFFVRRITVAEPEQKPENSTFSLSFKDSTAGQIIEMLATQSNTPIEIQGALIDRPIGFIRLQEASVKEALESIALLLGAQVAWKDGRYILSAPRAAHE